ncbi:hypothetical protein MPRG_32980 [Mycobacterium paragordonae]|uniref:Uncharacterized protein n=1 Tax=Mycobacterium paragordonae TaxID=1389713 RepID=A0ABQ1C6H2_9MYCO|nr:hypothetical protein MPRG_32980 [Mycobacterium paragordonae]
MGVSQLGPERVGRITSSRFTVVSVGNDAVVTAVGPVPLLARGGPTRGQLSKPYDQNPFNGVAYISFIVNGFNVFGELSACSIVAIKLYWS